MTHQPILKSPKQDRVIRVFVSSTFRDMHAEREELVKFTFPELRRRCRERQVEFVDVDLRWGITDEQKAEGRVLPICLAEIERCRPYFIGLLGERYGWLPHSIDDDLIRQEPWLQEHREKSVTEFEILHGVLKDPKMKGLAFFYFRNKEVSDAIEDLLSKEPAYIPEPEASRVKLNILKQRIEASTYPLKKNYPDAKTLGQWVLNDLWSAIDERYPIQKVPTELEQRRIEHDAFAFLRRKVYIGRKEYFDTLDNHSRADGPPLVILGESGSGKSALLANWAYQYGQKHPEDFIVCHFIGSTRDSADYTRIIQRITEEFNDHFSLEIKIPEKREELRATFANVLNMAAVRGRTIIILDALNQLEDYDGAPDLGWLPPVIPQQVRMFLSTLPGRPLDELKKRGWLTVEVKPLDREERKRLSTEFLAQFSKTLNTARIERIANAEQTAIPLFLQALLDELRQFGSNRLLDEIIESYLSAKTVPELYGLILDRYEKDYDRERPGLVKDTVTLLWAARRGLAESEMLDLLGLEGQPIAGALWSPLYLAMEQSLVNRSGLVGFFHDYFRIAVQERYLAHEEQKRAAHLRLAHYFQERELGRRQAEELPYHLQHAEEWEDLANLLTDLDFFAYAWDKGYDRDAVAYWYSLHRRFEPAARYEATVGQLGRNGVSTQQRVQHLRRIGDVLERMAFFGASRTFYMRALQVDDSYHGTESGETARDFGDIGLTYFFEGNFESALNHLKQALDIQRRIGGLKTIAEADLLSNIGLLHWEHGHFTEAKEISEEVLLLREKLLGSNHRDVALSLNNLAAIYHVQGFYAEALPYYERSLAIREKILSPDDTDVAQSLNNLGSIYCYLGRYQDSLDLSQRALRINEQAYGQLHPYVATSCNNIAMTYHKIGNLTEAEKWMRRVIKIDETRLLCDHPAFPTHLANLGIICSDMGKFKEALALIQRALEIAERIYGSDHSEFAHIARELAATYIRLDDITNAEPLLERARVIFERDFGKLHHKLADTLLWMGTLHVKKHDMECAEHYYRSTLSMREQLFGEGHPELVPVLNSLAFLLYDKGDYDGAEPLHRRALAIREKVLGPEHPDTATTINNLANLLHSKGDYEGAESLHKKALAIREKGLGPEHLDIAFSLNSLANLLYRKGDYDRAEPLYRRALAIREKVLAPEHPDTVQGTFDLALLLRDKGDHTNAEPLYHRILNTYENLKKQETRVLPQLISTAAACHNNLAFHTEVTARNWGRAEFHYTKSIELFKELQAPVEIANVELNLQTLFFLSGQKVDLKRIKELTTILKEAGDKRAEKGYKLLKEMS